MGVQIEGTDVSFVRFGRGSQFRHVIKRRIVGGNRFVIFFILAVGFVNFKN